MTCPECGGTTVEFAVPERLRDHAPEGGAHAAICATCLQVYPAADGSSPPDFAPLGDFFPGGDGGVALALATGLLGSLALNRREIVDLCEIAEVEGADVLLTLDRLAEADGIEPHFDLDRRRPQLAQLLE
jgi:hypothetical protein